MLLMHPYKRYKEIFEILVKYGFEDAAGAFNIKEHSIIRRKFEKPEYKALAKLPIEKRARMVLEDLGPTFIKFGQILSTRPDLIPAEWAEELKKLQDSLPTIPHEKIQAVIETETGKKIEEVFPYFEKEPIASASIGQVHIAKLNGGKKVIVKVQKPGIKEKIENDIKILHEIAGLLTAYVPEVRRHSPDLIVTEFAKTIRREQNYVREARNAARIGADFKDDESFYVPEVYWEYTTRKLLVLEYIDGIKFNDFVEKTNSRAEKRKVADTLTHTYMKMILEHGFFHADPHPGNFLILKDRKDVIALVDYGMTGYIDRELRSNLIKLLYAVAKQDSDKIIAVFTDIGMLSDDTDMRQFRSDFYEVLNEYLNTELREVKLSEMFHDLMDVSRVHKVRFPHNFVYLVKVIGEVESATRRLDDSYNITHEISPYLRSLVEREMKPEYIVKNIHEGLMSFNDFIWKTPKKMSNIFNKLEQGKLKIDFELMGLDPINRHIENAANKVTLSMVIASVIIASSLLIHAQGGTLVTILGVLGYVFAGLLGLALVFTIIRDGRF